MIDINQFAIISIELILIFPTLLIVSVLFVLLYHFEKNI